MTAETIRSPNKTLKIIVDGGEREIFMSYGLQDAILRLVRDTNEIGNVYSNPDVRNGVLAQVLAERTRTGKIATKREFDDYEIEIEEVEKILEWVVSHVTAFFIRVIETLDRRMIPDPAALLTQDSQLTPSLDGSKA